MLLVMSFLRTNRLVILIIGILIAVIVANNLTPHQGDDDYIMPFSGSLETALENRSGNIYTVQEGISIDIPLTGDIYAVSSTLNISDHLTGDIGFIGETLTVKEGVDGDIRAIAETVLIDQQVRGEIIFLGTDLQIEEDGIVKGTTTAISAETVTIAGVLQGDLHASGGTLLVRGAVTGNIYANNVNRVVIQPNAIVNGDIITDTTDTVTVDEGATVSGTVKTAPSLQEAPGLHAHLYNLLTALIFLVVSSSLLFYLYRRRWNTFLRKPHKQSIFDTLTGFGVIIAGFIVPFVLLSVPGFLTIALATLLAVCTFILFSIFAAPIVLGIFLHRLFHDKSSVGVKIVITGILVTIVLKTISLALSFVILFLFTCHFIGHVIRTTLTHRTK